MRHSCSDRAVDEDLTQPPNDIPEMPQTNELIYPTGLNHPVSILSCVDAGNQCAIMVPFDGDSLQPFEAVSPLMQLLLVSLTGSSLSETNH